MRQSLRGAVGLTAGLFVLSAVPAQAQRETSLLGIKLWRTWRDVLKKHGQPSRIEVGAVTTTMGGQGAAGSAFGGGMAGGPMMGGAMPGMGGMGMGPGGPMAGGMGPGGPMGSSMMSRMMSSQMRPQMGSGGGMPMGGAPMGGPSLPGMAGGGKMGEMMGSGGGPTGGQMDDIGGAGMPLGGGAGPLGGFGMSPGGPMGGGMPGFGGGGQVAVSEGEVTWVYEKPKGLTLLFLFNKDGRVIQISQFGYSGGGSTSRGVTLGDRVSEVYSKYGWANSSSKVGDQLTLDYSHKANVAFQLLNRGKGTQVVGVTVAITERDRIPGQG